MDLLIRGMKMPKSCSECRLYVENCWCVAIEKENWRKAYNTPPEGERLPDCPLAPLPKKHGRLIDADALRAEIDRLRPGRSYEDAWALTVVDNAPTVIAAEGGGDDA